MDPKPRPNHDRYAEIIRRMSPAQRLDKAIELTELTRELLLNGLRQRHPHISEAQLHQLYLDRLRRCHSANS